MNQLLFTTSMRITLLICILLYSFAANGQYLKLENEKYTFEKVDSAGNLTKQQIYAKARTWMISNLKTSDSNVELSDTSFSTLISTGNMSTEVINIAFCAVTNGTLNFKMKVQIREGRYKVVIDNMSFSDTRVCYSMSAGVPPTQRYEEFPLEKSKDAFPKKKHEGFIKEIDTKLLKLCTDLNQTIVGTKPSKDDW